MFFFCFSLFDVGRRKLLRGFQSHHWKDALGLSQTIEFSHTLRCTDARSDLSVWVHFCVQMVQPYQPEHHLFLNNDFILDLMVWIRKCTLMFVSYLNADPKPLSLSLYVFVHMHCM